MSAPELTHLRVFAPRNLRVQPNGLPMTYDISLGADGKLDRMDLWRERHLLRTRRCGVCGDELGSEVAFIGTSTMAARLWFSTPGLHVDCARYAFATCPFIAKPHWRASDAHKRAAVRTPEIVMVIAGRYRYSRLRWWIGKLIYRRARLDLGFAKARGVRETERHVDRAAMLDYLNQRGGCPAHEVTTGSIAHPDPQLARADHAAAAAGCPYHAALAVQETPDA